MPIARFQMPDGKIGRFEVPEGTTPEEAQALISQFVGGQQAAPAAQSAPTETQAEAIAANPATRFALGAASPILGAAQLAEKYPIASQAILPGPAVPALQLLGKHIDLPALEKMKRAGMKAAGDETDVAGFLGSVFSPAFLAAAKAVPGGLSYVQRLLTGTSIGATAGATTPVTNENADFATEKAIQTGVGALAGGAVAAAEPVVTGTAKAGYRALIEPWANPAAVKGRALLEASGDKLQQILALLRQNKEIVPGSAPTAAEAAAPAGRAEFSGLERQVQKANPSPYVARVDEQNAARLAAVRSVGKDDAAISAAETARRAAGQRDYGAVEKILVKADSEVSNLLSRPSMDKALARAAELAKEKGQTFAIKTPATQELSAHGDYLVTKPGAPTQFSVQSMHNVKMALDDMIKNPERFGIGASEVGAINQTRRAFIQWLETKAPAYELARKNYAAMSQPINQMQIGQFLESKLTPALSDEAKQKAGTYAQALREAPSTIKRATGEQRFQNLDEILTPEQLKVVTSVRDDLARSARSEHLGAKGNQATQGATVEMNIPNFLNRAAMITNAIITRLEGKINKKLAAELAVDMLNPPKVADSLVAAQRRAANNAVLAAEIQRRVLTVPGAIAEASQQ